MLHLLNSADQVELAAAPAEENNDALVAALVEPLDEYDGGSYCDDDYACCSHDDQIKQLYLEIARQTNDMTGAADVLMRLIGKLPPAETFEDRSLRREAMHAHFNVAYAPAVFDNDIANIIAELRPQATEQPR